MKKLTAFIALMMFGVSAVFAEATKEIYSDGGLYSGNPPGSFVMDISMFSASSINGDAKFADATAPEGKTSFRVQVNNTGFGGVGIFNKADVGTGNTPRDYSGYESGALRFWLKSDRTLKLEIIYGLNISKSVNVNSTGNQWVEQVIPFSAFGTLNFAQIRVPFQISHQGGGVYPVVFFVDHVRWTKPVTAINVFPSNATASAGKHVLYTSEGRDAANELVLIYPSWSATGGGTIPAAKASSALLTKGASGNGTVTATDGAISGSANFTHVAVSNATFGIVSETVAGLVLDTDSKLQTFQGGGAQAIVLSDDFANAPEGSKSIKAVVNQPAAGFSGWTVQWGLETTTDAFVKDMTTYYDGSIRFWFKAPAALQNVTNLGIRSGNVPAGKETSKVLLRNYTTFDNTWRAVTIPIADLAKSRPFADISRTKIFFGIYVEGSSGGSQSFWVDNVRWDTTLPGPMTSLTVQPSAVTMPPSSKRIFYAVGRDAANNPIDVSPAWSITGGIGTLSATSGPNVLLTAAGSNASGQVRATFGALPVAASNVTVQPISFNQSYNVYSDAGAGGDVGVSAGPAGFGSAITLDEPTAGAIEGAKFMQATFTLRNSAAGNDAFAVWFVEQANFSRFMRAYETGYLRFNVRTTHDLEVSVRSENILPDANTAKFRLSELGIPRDGTWQEVIIPLADFKARTSGANLLNFDQIKTFFAIGALSSASGQATNATFDVDNVKWLTTVAAGTDKVYQGLVEKQRPSGLVRSFETLPQAVTYDQALAAMAFTYRRDFTKANAIFTFYRNLNQASNGFRDEYNVDTGAIIDQDRLVGPNAWMLLALIHHRVVSGSTTNDAMIDQLAAWLRSFQDPDGGVKFGTPGPGNGTNPGIKATEFNLDCYAAFKAYAQLRNNIVFRTAANRVLDWLGSQVWNAAQGRFNLGVEPGRGINPDKALDAYSWGVLAIAQSTHSVLTPAAINGLLSRAETEFRTQKAADLTGNIIDGFDFSGQPNFAPDKDAVWLEGTGQMSVAYRVMSNATMADQFANEMEKAIVDTSATGQGLPYATNAGTGYGFIMDSLHPAVSAAAWYLFAKSGFNPMQPFPVYAANVRNVSNNAPAEEVTWNATVPNSGWVRGNQYVELAYQPNDISAWGIQIYTDNKNVAIQTPTYVDPTPGNLTNSDSDPAGLVLVTGGATSSEKLPMAWSIKELVTDLPAPMEPNNTGLRGCPSDPNAFQWFYMLDKGTPAVDLFGCDNVPYTGTAFVDGNDYSRVAKGVNSSRTAHSAQGPDGYFPTISPDYIFFQTNLANAAPQDVFVTKVNLEFFFE